MYRIAVVGDDDVKFQWHSPFDTAELAQGQAPTAQAEFPGHAVSIEQLVPIDEDNSAWVEVTE